MIKYYFFQDDFGLNSTFPEGQLIKMGKKAIQMIGIKDEEFYEGMGSYFVDWTSRLGRRIRLVISIVNPTQYSNVKGPKFEFMCTT